MGTYHCLFEQSGTFKNEFKKLGYAAFDSFGSSPFPSMLVIYRKSKNGHKKGYEQLTLI